MNLFGAYGNDDIILIDEKKVYKKNDVIKLVLSQMEHIKNYGTVVVSNRSNFNFFINFFASVFLDKEIYLLSDNNKIKELNFKYELLDEIAEKSVVNVELPKISDNKAVINFYTSGSSGCPKVVKKTLHNLIQEGLDLKEKFPVSKGANSISTTTMAHLFGMTFHLFYSLLSGFKICTKTINYPLEVNNFDNYIFISTPAFLQTVKNYNIQFKKLPKYIISAGSKLNEDVFEFLISSNNKIIEIYGSTETGVIAYKNFPKDDFTKFDNVEIEIKDNKTFIKSKYIFEKVVEINDNIELKENKLVLKKRKDRLLKIFEKRISPLEIEEKLNRNEFILESYVLKSGDKLASIQALSDVGRDFLLKEGMGSLIKNLKNYIGKYFEIIPQKWKFTDIIPKTQTGKIDTYCINKIFNVNCSYPVILNRIEGEYFITYKIFFQSSCNFFKGHFDGFNILPGVIQIFIAKEFSNRKFNLNLGEGQWKRIKFSNIIFANSIVYLKLTKKEKTVDFEYFDDDKTYSSGCFLLENVFRGLKNELI